MTHEERLQKIKNSHEERVKANEFYTLGFIHADWLIEQAERVQELEKKNSRLRKRNKELRHFKNTVLEV